MDVPQERTAKTRDWTRWPIRAIAICAAGMGVGFGLCSVGLVTGGWFDLKDFGAGMLLLCLGGLIVSVVWLVVAAVVSAIVSDRGETRRREGRE